MNSQDGVFGRTAVVRHGIDKILYVEFIRFFGRLELDASSGLDQSVLGGGGG